MSGTFSSLGRMSLFIQLPNYLLLLHSWQTWVRTWEGLQLARAFGFMLPTNQPLRRRYFRGPWVQCVGKNDWQPDLPEPTYMVNVTFTLVNGSGPYNIANNGWWPTPGVDVVYDQSKVHLKITDPTTLPVSTTVSPWVLKIQILLDI